MDEKEEKLDDLEIPTLVEWMPKGTTINAA